MSAVDFAYTASDLHHATGISRARVTNIIEKIPQIERGREKGFKHSYRYNYDIVLGDGAIARGAVY